MVEKSINRMFFGKAASFSGIDLEALKPSGPGDAGMIRDLIGNIISVNRIPLEWQESHIVIIYRSKSDSLNRSNYRGLKLIEQVMKVL